MDDPRTFWLTVTNVVLGLAVLLLILGVLTGVLCDYVAQLRKRRALLRDLDRDMHRLFLMPPPRKHP
jgi:hypothetical protein